MGKLDKLRACFFTGHRLIAAQRLIVIKEKLLENIERLIAEYDVKSFISGGAIGFDTIAAEAVIEIRKKYPHIKLLMYLPCYGQSERWDSRMKYRYNMVLSKADNIIFVTKEKYSAGCMQKRNMKMSEDAFFCIAYCLKPNSGTGATLRSAAEKGARVINIADEFSEN